MITDLIIVGDEAYSPEEWEAEQRRRAARKARGRKTAYWREYRQRNREKYAAYRRASRQRCLTDDELEAKIDYHQGFVDRYTAELRARRREAA